MVDLVPLGVLVSSRVCKSFVSIVAHFESDIGVHTPYEGIALVQHSL